MPERVTTVGIEAEMRESYLDYAMSVIVARALPDVRDGLKPVQRRIIYAMGEMSLWPSGPHRKSARIVGEVLGKFHPHNDTAVYEAMVRMAQTFSLRYPLVDGQGNFGSVDGDAAAAMRYTEARLSTIAREMLEDIDKDTVEFTGNFDESLQEPTVLPARLPNLLVNGSAGIAVGMATSIPPHNLGEVCNALLYLLDNYETRDKVDTDELLRFIPGPDFPTGGILYAGGAEGVDDPLRRAYASGRGQVAVRAKVTMEDAGRGSTRLIVTELPYLTNKARLIERIAELARADRLQGIADLRDESDRDGMRLVIETSRGVDGRQLLIDLYRLTPMQSTFSIMMLALVNGEPRTLSLKRLLLAYLEHRLEVVRRRSEYDLAKAREREHILTGLLIALRNIDEVIATIRRSRTVETARTNLMRNFDLSERQAQAILDMPLRRLAALERKGVEDEHKAILTRIAELEALLGDPSRMRAAIREEVLQLRTNYGDARRTQIVSTLANGAVLTAADMVPDTVVTVMADGQGRLAYQATAKRQRLYKGTRWLVQASLRQRLCLVSAGGRARVLPVHSLPEGQPGDAPPVVAGNTAAGRLAAIVALPPDLTDRSLLLATSGGRVKRMALDGIGEDWTAVVRLEEGDRIVGAVLVQESDSIMLVSSSGEAVAFTVAEVRQSGLPAGCIAGMRLAAGAEVVAAFRLTGQHVAVATSTGLLKRVTLRGWRLQKRGGQGIVATPVDVKTGRVVSAVCLSPEDKLLLSGSQGSAELLPAGDIPALSRASRGRATTALKQGEEALSVSVQQAPEGAAAKRKAKAEAEA
ncbi:MAG: DNA gyrase/topoisomerase IV subunit A [Anaerolineae bacterium]